MSSYVDKRNYSFSTIKSSVMKQLEVIGFADVSKQLSKCYALVNDKHDWMLQKQLTFYGSNHFVQVYLKNGEVYGGNYGKCK